MLEFAILGLLQESAMHGYELRKQLATKLGPIRAAISYGSLYPTLRRLQAAGWITEEAPASRAVPAPDVPALTSRRSRVVYKITAEGKEHFQDLLAQSGPETYDDAGFSVHFAFFSRTDADTRLRILEGRRRKVEERREGLREMLGRAAERLDAYTLELQRHGLDAAEREVRWLEELIATERSGRQPGAQATGDPAGPARPAVTGDPGPARPPAGTPTGAQQPDDPAGHRAGNPTGHRAGNPAGPQTGRHVGPHPQQDTAQHPPGKSGHLPERP